MTPFFVLFSVLCLGGIMNVGIALSAQQKGFLWLIIFIFLFVFTGLRYDNIDYQAYMAIFDDPWEYSADKGFAVLISLIKIFSNSSIYMFLIMALLSVSINLSCYKKYSPYFLIAILFYFVHSYLLKDYIQIRAGLSCAICLYSVRYIENKKLGKYLLCLGISLSIHLSSIIFLPVYFAGNLVKKKKAILYILVIACIIGSVYPFGQLLKNIPFVDETSRLATYSGWDDFSREVGIFTNPITVKQIIICLFCYIYMDRLKEIVVFFSPLFVSYILSTCWLMLFNDFAIIGARMATFLSIGEPIFIAASLCLFTQKSRISIVPFYIIVAYLIMILNFQTKSIGPYQFYPF